MALQESRAKFLSQASQLLWHASPSISAELSYHSLSLRVRSTSSASQKQPPLTCAACGSFHLKSSTSAKSARWPKAFQSKPSSTRRSKNKRTCVQRCAHCLRVSRSCYDPPDVDTKNLKEVTKSEPADEKATISKSTGKQRAKARKDRESLQAILDKNKRDTRTVNFDLMDFMNS